MSARWRRRWARISTLGSAARARGDGTAASATAAIRALAAGLESLARPCRGAAANCAAGWRRSRVADEDRGQILRVGQRLVTRDGQLRRWDGFVASGGGAAAAERLLRANRLAEIDREIACARAGGQPAQRKPATARRPKSTDSARPAEAARASAAAAEREAREAARAEDGAVNALERLEAQRGALAEREADLAPVREAAAASLSRAEAHLAELPDPAAMGGEIDAARDAASIAGQAVADKRAEAATRARMTAADRERHATAGREQEANGASARRHAENAAQGNRTAGDGAGRRA